MESNAKDKTDSIQPSDQKTFYDHQFKKIAGSKAEENIREFYCRELAAIIEAHVPEKKSLDVLEVGVGEGILMQKMAAHFSSGCFEGIEISEKNLRIARSKGLNVRQMDAHRISSDKKYDLIYGTAILHHLDDIGAFLKRLSGLLKPDGIILFGAEPDHIQILYICYHKLRRCWHVEKGMMAISAKKLREWLKEDYRDIWIYRKGNCFAYASKGFGRVWNGLRLSKLPFLNDLYIIARKK